MVTAQIVGKTELAGIFKDLVENGEEFRKLSEVDREILLTGFAANICYTEKKYGRNCNKRWQGKNSNRTWT